MKERKNYKQALRIVGRNHCVQTLDRLPPARRFRNRRNWIRWGDCWPLNTVIVRHYVIEPFSGYRAVPAITYDCYRRGALARLSHLTLHAIRQPQTVCGSTSVSAVHQQNYISPSKSTFLWHLRFHYLFTPTSGCGECENWQVQSLNNYGSLALWYKDDIVINKVQFYFELSKLFIDYYSWRPFFDKTLQHTV